jgi:hypothetical protein
MPKRETPARDDQKPRARPTRVSLPMKVTAAVVTDDDVRRFRI